MSATDDFFCPANSTATVVPASAVPQTGTRISRCNTALSVNGDATVSSAITVPGRRIAARNHPAIIARIIKRLFFILFPLLFIQCFAFFPIDRPEWPPHSTRVRRSILAIFIQLGK